ncbi:MAG TPA: tripartite tricarboxylate transporter substrate binding protein, partial [Burkholderiales bacterium]|jgi:tripartite-type tricarboxylate transporter receptor subunit TctC|nr:tripartite tricarboxylate transporter substrate binding protein [Burkholderiales bacterium]
VPFTPGGGLDIQARLFGKKFYETLGQTFVVENRTGAGGLIGAEAVARSAPDGYTLLFSSASLAVNVSLYKKLAFDPVKDFDPVSWVSSVPLVLVVHPSVPVKSVPELVALARKRAGQFNASSNGIGTTSHLSIEMLKQYAGVAVTHVPYKGGGPATTAVLSGEVDIAFVPVLSAQPFMKSGKVKVLAVTTAKRSSILPDVPTMKSYYPEFESDNWYAFFVPAGTPQDIVTKLNAEILKALKAPDVIDYLSHDGADPVGSTPAELAANYRREIVKYAKLIKAANIQPE